MDCTDQWSDMWTFLSFLELPQSFFMQKLQMHIKTYGWKLYISTRQISHNVSYITECTFISSTSGFWKERQAHTNKARPSVYARHETNTCSTQMEREFISMPTISNTDLQLSLSSFTDSYRALKASCLCWPQNSLISARSQILASGCLCSLSLCCLCVILIIKHASSINSSTVVILKHLFVDHISYD